MRFLCVPLTILALALAGCASAGPRTAPPATPQDDCQVEPQPLSCAADADARAAKER